MIALAPQPTTKFAPLIFPSSLKLSQYKPKKKKQKSSTMAHQGFTKTRKVDFHTNRVDIYQEVRENYNLGQYGKG